LENGTIGFLAVLDVFEFGGQIMFRIGIDGVPEDFDKEFT
jgi:hypothetical protein